jgi:YARHG domain
MKSLFVATLAAMTMISPAFARSSDLCEALWLQRNAYYKDAGYCFKTPRAIRYFGNAGCMYDEESAVPLSRSLRNRITDISRAERQLACSD